MLEMKLPGSSWFPRALVVRSWDNCITSLQLATSGSEKRASESENGISGPDVQGMLSDGPRHAMFVRPGRNQTRPHEQNEDIQRGSTNGEDRH